MNRFCDRQNHRVTMYVQSQQKFEKATKRNAHTTRRIRKVEYKILNIYRIHSFSEENQEKMVKELRIKNHKENENSRLKTALIFKK